MNRWQHRYRLSCDINASENLCGFCNAWKALMWENRLEFAMEGRRFYDLVRWGIAAETMNTYFDKESQRRPWLDVAYFTKGRDEYLPIPQAQMNWSQGVYVQNPGY